MELASQPAILPALWDHEINRQMNQTQTSLVLGNLKALFLAVILAVLLVTAYEFAQAVVDQVQYSGQGEAMLSLGARMQIAALSAGFTAVIVAIACIPIWNLIGRRGLRSFRAATLLGFIATMVAWVVIFNWGGFGVRPVLEFRVIADGLPFAVFGAIAGAACWWQSPARHVSRQDALNQ
jgi:hypothetical protein